ncbi:MAG: hypothetical protein R3C00_05085 [Hyphomonas sp.]|nr:hypothetical protein [Hyphomonas sp.]
MKGVGVVLSILLWICTFALPLLIASTIGSILYWSYAQVIIVWVILLVVFAVVALLVQALISRKFATQEQNEKWATESLIDSKLNELKSELSSAGQEYVTSDELSRMLSALHDEGKAMDWTFRRLKEYMKSNSSVLLFTEFDHGRQFGNVNPKKECRFCGESDCVRVKTATVTEQSRANSAVGSALGVGMNTEKDKFRYHCDRCHKTWYES